MAFVPLVRPRELPNRGTHEYTAILDDVIEEQNKVTFLGEGGQEMRRVPLDCITTVYEDWDSQLKKLVWRMLVDYERRVG